MVGLPNQLPYKENMPLKKISPRWNMEVLNDDLNILGEGCRTSEADGGVALRVWEWNP